MNKAQLQSFLSDAFPDSPAIIDSVAEGSSRVRWPIGEGDLRPGATVSGPTLFAVADLALYAAILALPGQHAMAVTTSLNINFLSKPFRDRDIVGECRLIKSGKRLVVGEVFIYSEGLEEPVAHATGTYSIPSSRD